MTTPNSNSPPGSVENVDTGPLSWVMVEIRESLNRSRAALAEALTQDAETQGTTLRHAKSFLHQAHGALQIVDVDGVAIITETVEDLFDRVESGQLAFTAAVADAIANAYQALLEYLEELLSGVPHQPVRLFPYYRTLLEARGIRCGVVHAHTVKPLDAATIAAAASGVRLVVSVEEHFRAGGLGSAVVEAFADLGMATPVMRLGFTDAYSYDFGSQDHVLRAAGLDAAAIAARVEAALEARAVPA